LPEAKNLCVSVSKEHLVIYNTGADGDRDLAANILIVSNGDTVATN